MPSAFWLPALLAIPVLVGLILALRKAPPKIFISYRRADTQPVAGRLQADLTRHFGKRSLFRDVNNIRYFEELDTSLPKAIAGSAVFLPLIGSRWSGAIDGVNESRLEDPEDFVRLEVENALRFRPPLLPVLASGASMPLTEDLPDSLRRLTAFPALELRDESWRDDLAKITTAIEQLIGNPKSQRRRILAICVVAVILLVAPATIWAIENTRQAWLLQSGESPGRALYAILRLEALGGCYADCLRRHLAIREDNFEGRETDNLSLWASGRPLALGWLELPESERPATVIKVVRALTPASTMADHLGELLAVLDEVAVEHEDYRETRQGVIQQLTREFGAPPGIDDKQWCKIPVPTSRIQIGCFAERDPTCLFKRPDWSLKASRDEEPRYYELGGEYQLMCEEVSLQEYLKFDPGHQQDDKNTTAPVRNVSWFEVYAFATWRGFRLPTEAQWEYATRAGCHGPLWSSCPKGSEQESRASMSDTTEAMRTLSDVAIWRMNSNGKVRSVSLGVPNPYGLKNVHGNVAEWCLEWYPEGSAQRAGNGVLYGYKIIRGGSYVDDKDFHRSSHVGAAMPWERLTQVGVRLAK